MPAPKKSTPPTGRRAWLVNTLKTLAHSVVAKPPAGFSPIPGSKHQGYHKQVGTRWVSWYPSEIHARGAALEHSKAQGRSQTQAASHLEAQHLLHDHHQHTGREVSAYSQARDKFAARATSAAQRAEAHGQHAAGAQDFLKREQRRKRPTVSKPVKPKAGAAGPVDPKLSHHLSRMLGALIAMAGPTLASRLSDRSKQTAAPSRTAKGGNGAARPRTRGKAKTPARAPATTGKAPPKARKPRATKPALTTAATTARPPAPAGRSVHQMLQAAFGSGLGAHIRGKGQTSGAAAAGGERTAQIQRPRRVAAASEANTDGPTELLTADQVEQLRHDAPTSPVKTPAPDSPQGKARAQFQKKLAAMQAGGTA